MTLGPFGNATPSRFTSVLSPTCTASPMRSGTKTAPLDARADAAIFNARAELVAPHAYGEKLRRRFVLRAGHS
jgi:hypothetical protein